MASTSLYAAHEKLQKARSTRTGYRRKRMDLAQGRATTQVKGEAEREMYSEAISGLQSIATMADEWKQQREMDSAIHSAFTELEGAKGLEIDERKGLKRWTKGKYKYSRGGKELTGAERFQALVDHGAGKDAGGKFWSAPEGKVETQSSDEFVEESPEAKEPMADNVGNSLSGASKISDIVSEKQMAEFKETEFYDPDSEKTDMWQFRTWEKHLGGYNPNDESLTGGAFESAPKDDLDFLYEEVDLDKPWGN